MVGRKFAVLEDGRMELVPWGTEVGGFVAAVPRVRRCVVLRRAVIPRKQKHEEEEDENGKDEEAEAMRYTEEDGI